MVSRHGLTLLEMLLATALLAVIAATCVPLLQQSLTTLHVHGPSGHSSEDFGFGRADLAALADSIIDDPGNVGIDLQALTTTTIAWPEYPNRPPVQLARLIQLSAEETSRGSWLVLSCDRWHIHRYLPPPPDGANGPPRGLSEGGDP